MITIDPAIINQILTTSFTSFPKGEKFRERAVDFLGGGVFASDGAEWSFVSVHSLRLIAAES